MNLPSLLATIFLAFLATFAQAQITGPNPTYQGSTQVYTWNGATLTSPNWIISNGVKISQTSNSATVTWNTGVSGGSVVLLNAGTFRGSLSVTLLAAPSIPSVPAMSAASSISATYFTANWGTSPEAESYLLDVSTSSSFDSFVSGYQNLPVTGISQVVSGLTGGGTFYYQVRAVNGAGTSGYSDISLPVEVFLKAPTNTNVIAGVNSFDISWDAALEATGYVLDVATDSTFMNMFNSYSVGVTNKSVTGLSASTTYWIRIKSYYGSTYSSYSSTMQETTLTPPQITGDTLVDAGTTNVYTWTGTFSNPNWIIANGTKDSQTGNSVTATWNIDAPGGAVVLTDGGTHLGTLNITIFPVPTPPTNINATAHPFSLDLTWDAASGAVSYLLDVATDSTFNNMISGFEGLVVNDTSKVVDGLNPKTNYWIRIKSYSGNKYSSYSDYVQQTTLDRFATINKNYIISNTVLIPGVISQEQMDTVSRDSISQTVQYFDGLGRPIQTVMTMGSPLKKDIIQPVVYDEFGRESVKYLPYVSDEDNGWYDDSLVRKEDETNYPNSDQAKFYQGLSAPNVAIDSRPYAETIFESSPISRPVKQYGAGDDWYANDKYTGMEYLINTHGTGSNGEEEKIIAWDLDQDGMPIRHEVVTNYILSGGYYDKGQLKVNVTKDESGHAVREYTNKLGQVILKKVQVTEAGAANLNDVIGTNPGWALTYYIYDEFGSLVYVFQPELSKQIHDASDITPVSDTQLTNLAFQYKYDGRMRMIEKKVPGSGWVYMVYDKRDRLVLAQDANQRTKKEWSFTKYDLLNRPVMIGLYIHSDSISRLSMEGLVSTTQFVELYDDTKQHGYTTSIFPTTNLTMHTVTFYDNYDFRDDLITDTSYDYKNDHLSGQETTAFDRLKGLVTGTKVNVLGSDDYLWSVSYYDDRYRVIQSVMQNHKDSLDRTTSIYDFVGKVEKTKTTHSTTSTSMDIKRVFAYDHTGRLLKTYHQIDEEDEVLLSQNQYNELGELVTKELHSRNESDFTQWVDYRYNIRGWLSSINDPAINSTGLFNFQLKYNDPTTNGGDAQYNGNISQAIWKTAGNDEQSYGYYYDDMNRITEAKYFNHDHSVDNDRFNEVIKDGSNSGYDLNGNILKLQRHGKLTATSYGLMDNLSYTYTGNQLTRVDDLIATQTHEKGFKEISEAANEYGYDYNGNMVKDDNKGIVSIAYNHLNLPSVVKKSSADSIVYTYDATGRKLKQTVFGAQSKTTDYVGEFVYENDTLRFINHEEGRILPDTTTSSTYPWEYQYHLKDHLGNVRVTFSEKTETTEYLATMEKNVGQNPGEPDHDTQENAMFLNMDINLKNSMYNHTTEAGANDSYLLRGVPGEVVGPAKSMIVEAGDIVDMEVYARYNAATTTDSDIANYLTSIIGAFGLSTSGSTVLDGSQAYSAFESNFAAGAWLGTEDYEDENAPGAFLNYLLFDTNFALVDAGFQQVTSAGATGFDYLALHIKANQPGYLYIYLSNENQKVQDVYFDDFKVTHHTNVEQSNDYYPFGLTFNSYQRENKLMNKILFQGQEHIDALDLGWDSFKWRNHQPDIGRFFNVDPLAEKYYYNSPYAFSENKVVAHVELEGLEAESIKKVGNGFKDFGKKWTDPETYSKIGNGFKNLGERFGEMVPEVTLPNIVTTGPGQSSDSGNLSQPRSGGKTIFIDMDFVGLLDLIFGTSKTKSSTPAKNKSGKKDGKDLKDISKSSTDNKDKDALEAFKGDANQQEPVVDFLCNTCQQVYKDSANTILPSNGQPSETRESHYAEKNKKTQNN